MKEKKDNLKDQWMGRSSVKGAKMPDSSSFRPAPDQDNAKQDEPESKYFGVDIHSAFVLNIKFIKRNGHTLRIWYALQPTIEFIPEEGLYVRTMQHEVLVQGRSLQRLEEWLGAGKVIWISESKTGKDDSGEALFVENITITSMKD